MIIQILMRVCESFVLSFYWYIMLFCNYVVEKVTRSPLSVEAIMQLVKKSRGRAHDKLHG